MYILVSINPDPAGGGQPYSFESTHMDFESAHKKREELEQYYKDLENTRSVYRGWTPKYIIFKQVG